jgi:hypothetical protein
VVLQHVADSGHADGVGELVAVEPDGAFERDDVLGARRATGQLLERLRSVAGRRRLLLVADSALVTKANLAAADGAGIRFVSRLPRTFDYETDALAQPEAAWRTLIYRAERSRRLPPAQRPNFRGAEATIDMAGPDKIARRFRVLPNFGRRCPSGSA